MNDIQMMENSEEKNATLNSEYSTDSFPERKSELLLVLRNFTKDVQQTQTFDQLNNLSIELIRTINSFHIKIMEISSNDDSIPKQFSSPNVEMLYKYIQKSQNCPLDLSKEESEISKSYNELLDYPLLLIQIDIQRHHRILSKAIKNKCNFNFDKFIKFINISNNQGKYENQSLLVYFNKYDFEGKSLEFQELESNPHFKSHYLEYRNDRYINLFNEKFDQLIEVQKILQNQKNHEEQINEIKQQNLDILAIQNQLKTDNPRINKSIQNQSNKCSLFLYNKNYPFNGIINWLNSKDRIKLTTPMGDQKKHRRDLYFSNIINFNESNKKSHSLSISGNSETNWLIFDFLDVKIDIFSYQIGSSDERICCYPKTWEIHGSNDQSNWDILDRRENCPALNGYKRIAHFICQFPTHKQYQFIRFYLLDTWHTNKSYQYNIQLGNVEMYGKLYT